MVKIGHWTDSSGSTGCTVILFDHGAVASGEVRGGAPATREFALLDPRRLIQEVDAVVLTGGSAFGLAAADGVMAWLAEQGRGYPTRSGPVPIVVAMALFDLAEGVTPPGAAQGEAAIQNAAAEGFAVGRVGAGAGATVGKWLGAERAVPAGLGYSTMSSDTLEVHALIAVNAVGDIDDGTVAAEIARGDFSPPTSPEESFENTTIGVVWTNAKLDKLSCRLVAESGHDGLGRALLPAHMQGDGDALVAASIGQVEAPITMVRTLAALAVEAAVRSVKPAT